MPNRREEDKEAMSYKTVSIVTIGFITTLVGHIWVSNIGEIKEKLREQGKDIVELKQDNRELKIMVSRLDNKKVVMWRPQ